MLFLALFGKEGSRGLEVIAKSRWRSEEERKQVIADMVTSGNIPVSGLIEVMINSYSESEKSKLMMRLKTIEEILMKGEPDTVSDALVKGIPRMMEAETKKTAMRVLTQVATAEHDAGIIGLMKHKDSAIRKGARDALIAGRRPETFNLLKVQLKDGKWPSRLEAITVCASLGGSEAVPVIKPFLNSSHEEAEAAIEALVGLQHKDAYAALDEITGDMAKASIKGKVAETLARSKDPGAVPLLVKLSQDENSKIQTAALKGLSGRNSPALKRNIQPLLENKNEQVRVMAIKLLGEIADESVIPQLVSCLKADELLVRQEAMSAIEELGKTGKVPLGKLIIGLMSEKDVNIRRTASELLKSVRDPAVLNDLIGFLRDEDWWVRDRVAEALGEIGGETVINEMIKMLQDDNNDIRRYAVDILATNKAKQAFKPLTQLLKDPDWWIREKVVEALGKIGEQKAVALLLKLLQVNELKWASVRALGELKAEEAIEPLVKMMGQEKERDSRIELLKALYVIGGGKVTKLATKLLNHEDKSMRIMSRDFLELQKVDVSAHEDVSKRKLSGTRSLSDLDKLLIETREKGGTDLFLAAERRPMVKKHGEVHDLNDQIMTDEQLRTMFLEILDQPREEKYLKTYDLDSAYETPLGDRFRVNLYRYRLGVAGCFRVIPDKVPTIEDLNMPQVLKKLCTLHQGIVLVTGPAASGKTTSMAALVDHANRIRQDHILTVEDPVEYVHEPKKALVIQREVYSHTGSFANALRAALREDPDVIVVGELRDLETISNAITAAETGHLVFGTLHTTSASNTVNRIIDAYPSNQQSQIRTMLSESLKAVISQQLVRKKDGTMTAALEILLGTRSLAKQIRDGALHQINSTIVTGRAKGMQTMDQALMDLLQNDVIDAGEAYRRAFSKKEFEPYLRAELGSQKMEEALTSQVLAGPVTKS